ncbi:helix-turn-helix transcriptional regulator [Pseudomonas sp.]|uniref:helix-turn-helix transcriptional regulator n=1 Tax=Pseudomonas sp. TaxID=306 RepID=UPI0028A70656|nr:helix-turn-helix transcriptional regulator [Pseudomonas sp.]
MRARDGLQHRENIIEACVIQARQPLTLPRMPVFANTLCRVRQGEKRLQWEDREMRAGPGHLILMPAGRELGISNLPGRHGHYSADAVTVPLPIMRGFSARYSQLILSSRSVSTTDLCVPLDTHTAQAWDQLLAAIHANAHPALRTHYAEAVLLSLCLSGHAGPLLTGRNDPLCERVQQLVMGSPERDWTVASIAHCLNLGESTLRRQLANEGDSFRNILEGVRLATALQLLQTTSRPVGEVAGACGYASASRFAVRFRARYGLSPRALRAAI